MRSFAQGREDRPLGDRPRHGWWRLTAALALARRHKSRLSAALACAGPLIVTLTAPPSVRSAVIVLGLAALVGVLPHLARRAARFEDVVNQRTAEVLPSRLLRPPLHIPLVFALIWVLGRGTSTSILAIGTLAAASAQACALGLGLAYKGRGDRIGNALLASAVFFNVATWHLATSNPAAQVIVAALDIWLGIDLARAAASDFRALVYPKTGVGVFFGTFNPVHKTHLAIMAAALRQRGLTKLYVHPTTVPKLHRTALANGEIACDYDGGMRVYYVTPNADPNKDYFPTGRRFFDYAARNELLKAAIADTQLEAWVEVLEVPQIYDAQGFSGVLAHVKRMHPKVPIHGLHGSDPGGMWVRALFDAAGGVHPFPAERRDGVSATAIRNGEAGMTTPTVTRFLEAMRNGQPFTFPNGRRFAAKGTCVSDSVADI